MSNNLEQWDEATEKVDISIDEMSALVKRMQDLRTDYEAKKKISNEASALYKEAQQAVIDAMEASGQKKFNVPGLGTCSLVTKFRVKVPDTTEGKRSLFKYIRDQYGQDFLDEMRSINYQTLNTFYKNEVEQAEANGQVLDVPGIDDPVAEMGTQWRADKK